MSEKITIKIDADLKDIIPTFLENRKKDIIIIEKALETNDLSTIESVAHKLAGNAGSYGLPDLGNIGASLENACQREDLAEVQKLHGDYQNYLQNLNIEFE